VLHHKRAAGRAERQRHPDADQETFIKMMAGTAGVKDTLLSDDLKVDGSKIDLVRFFSLIDKAPGTFQIVTK
jgi:alkyl sulfatase BDS1-like metallo-beta-lactamase superfamily hydrolase